MLQKKYGFNARTTRELLTESSHKDCPSEEDEFLDVLNKQVQTLS